MAEPELTERLRALRSRVEEVRAAQEPKPAPPDHHAQAHIAWRMVTEMVAGIGLGLAIGYGLDAVFGTRPLLLVVFTLLGFAAGVRVMLRTAQEVGQHVGAPPDGARAAQTKEEGRSGHG
jgi:ATP synthase protein I